MPITETRCVEITCDNQAGQPGDEHGWDDGTPHWPSREAALTDIVDHADGDRSWHVDGDRVLCPGCNARRVCQKNGHAYGPWLPCACQGRIGGHPIGTAGHQPWSRWCERCHDVDYQHTQPHVEHVWDGNGFCQYHGAYCSMAASSPAGGVA